MKKEFKLPEQMFKKALLKCKNFNDFVETVEKRMQAFDYYPTAICLAYTAWFEVQFTYHHMKWPDENETYTYKFSVGAKDTLIGHVSDYKKIILELFIRHFKDFFDGGELCWFHKIESIVIPSSEYDDMYISDLMAWADNYVGIYWEEQECGEHWIYMPKEPKKDIATYIKVK